MGKKAILCSSHLHRADLNMGCPDKQVVSMGSGAGLIHKVDLAQKVSKPLFFSFIIDYSNLY